VAAPHHAMAQVVHDHRSHLSRRVDRTGIRERPLQRIAFSPVASTNGSPCRPGIKSGRSMAQHHQAVPKFSLSRSLVRFRRGRFHWSTEGRLDCRSHGFPSINEIKFRVCSGGYCCLRRRGIGLGRGGYGCHCAPRGRCGVCLSSRRCGRRAGNVARNRTAANQQKCGKDQ